MMGWLSGYTTRKKIIIDHTKVDSALVNFPVLVKLRSTNFDFALTTDTGNDIRFTAANGVSLLDFERDRHDKTNQLAEYQVNIPNVSNSASTEFYIYFKDDPSIVDGANPTGVWDTSFQGRWSLDEDPTGIAPQIRDSTVNANHGTTHGGMTSAQSVEGKIGRALDFDGTNDYLNIPLNNFPALMSDITIEFWASPSGTLEQGSTFIAVPDQTTNRLNIHFPWESGVLHWDLGNIGAGGRLSASWDSTWNNIWAHWAFVSENGVGQRIYRNNVLLSSDTNASTFSPGAKTLDVARLGNTFWDGILDEIRISSTARSTAWIKASYNSSRDTLVTISITESPVINRSVSAAPQATVLAIRNISISKFRSVAVTPQVLIDRKPLSRQIFRSVSATLQVLIERKPLTRWVSWLSGYTTRKKITIDHTKVDSALVNFPVFVKLRSTNFDFTLTTDTGNDIRFTAANGVSLLDFERDRHDKINQQAEYQVRIPNVSNSAPTEFYIYFKDDPSIVDGSNPTGVWDTSFQGRWSLDEDPVGTAPQMRDSTVNANHGTTHGAMTSAQSVEGKIDRALDFDGSNDYLNIPLNNFPDPMTDITIEFWTSPSSAFEQGSTFIAVPDQTTNRLNIHFPWESGVLHWDFGNLGVGGRLSASWDSAWNNIWAHWAFVSENGVGQRIYRNNVLLSSDTNASTFSPGAKTLDVARLGNTFWDGILDEIRISSTVRSAAWIKASYNSSKNMLVTISATESPVINRSVAVTPQATVLAIRDISIPKSRSVSAAPQVLIDRKPRTRQMFRSVAVTPQATVLTTRNISIPKFRSVAVTPQALIDRKPRTRQMFRSVAVTPQVLIDRKPLSRQIFRSVSATPQANITYVLDDTMAALMKLPARKSGAKLSIWFDGSEQPATIFTNDHIKSIHLLHELNDGIAVGELSISLLNQNFGLTPSNPDSPFFNRFKPGLKIQAELGVRGPARVEWAQLGTYYLDSWNAPATTNTLSLVAYDQLFQLLESKALLGKQPAKANTTAQIMLSEALDVVGITNLDLTAMQPSIPIDIGWFTEDSPVQQVSLLLASGDFIAFVDRTTDRVRVISAGFSIQKRVYRFDSSTVFEAHNPQDYAGARSIVEYSFSRPAVKPFGEVWSGAELQQGTHVGLELTAPVAMLEFSHQKGVADWTIDAGVTYFDITVLSPIPSLKLFGCPIKDYPELVVATNPFAVQQYGKRVLRKVNRFVQNRTLATQLAEKHLARVSDHTNSFKFVASGQPALSFDHLVRLKIPEHRVDVDTLVLTKTETVYDGGLRLRAEGRRLV